MSATTSLRFAFAKTRCLRREEKVWPDKGCAFSSMLPWRCDNKFEKGKIKRKLMECAFGAICFWFSAMQSGQSKSEGQK